MNAREVIKEVVMAYVDERFKDTLNESDLNRAYSHIVSRCEELAEDIELGNWSIPLEDLIADEGDRRYHEKAEGGYDRKEYDTREG